MSWQDYIDKQLISTNCVKHAAIAGHDGGVWAKSKGFNVTQEEVVKILQGFEDPSILQESGLVVSGTRYIYLSGTDKILRAKRNKTGFHCVKTTQAVVICVYEEPIQPQQAASVVEKLGDYLVGCGF